MNEPGGFVKMLKCGIDCCKYESKYPSNLKRHKSLKHNICVKWHYCQEPNCEYKAKCSAHMKSHEMSIHELHVNWHYCQEPNCDYKSKKAEHIKRHNSHIHGLDVNWYYCQEPNCDYKSKQASNIKRHKSDIHNFDVKWHYCQEPNCDYKTKQASCLKTHREFTHNIDVKWHYCQEPDCDYKSKDKNGLKAHCKFAHNIDVKWHYCQEPDCDYKSKQASHIKVHCEFVHDIGTNQCEYCCNNRNSKNSYLCKITGITSNICNGCYNKVTGKNTRKEKEWSDYLDKHLGINGLLSSDKNLKSVGGCQRYRPDKLYTDLNYVEIAECDEFQHRYSNGTYDCDERRISEIYEEDGIIGKNMAVLRWNPDNYTPKEGLKKLSRNERLKVYVELSKKLREKTSHTDKIHIYYLFYSEDNPRLSKNIPYTMIHNLDEISNI